jgi:hypothetical protein
MMIDTIAKRRMTLNGKSYPKGAKVPMPLQQFNDLEPTGMVERAPAAPKAAAKPSANAMARKAATKPAAAKPAEPAPVATVSQPIAVKAD